MTAEFESVVAVEGTWLLLRAGRHDFALDASLIREVVALPGQEEFLPVPRAVREIPGALVVRGQPVPALCLAAWMEGVEPGPVLPSALVILEVPGLDLGLAVDAVAGPGGLTMVGEEERDRDRFMLGRGILENWPVTVLDGEALVTRLRVELGGVGQQEVLPEGTGGST